MHACQREHVYLNTCRGQSATSVVISEEPYTFVFVVVLFCFFETGSLSDLGSLIKPNWLAIENLGSVFLPSSNGSTHNFISGIIVCVGFENKIPILMLMRLGLH